MHIFTRKRSQGELEFGIIYGVLVIGALLSARFLPVSLFVPSCIFHRMSGIACPTCGATRSFVRFSQGNFSSAFEVNPFIAGCILFAVFYFVYSLIAIFFKFPRIDLSLTPVEKNRLRFILMILVLANWVYLIFTL